MFLNLVWHRFPTTDCIGIFSKCSRIVNQKTRFGEKTLVNVHITDGRCVPATKKILYPIDLCVAFFMMTMMVSFAVDNAERLLYFHFGVLTRPSFKLSQSRSYSWAPMRRSSFCSLVLLWLSSTVCNFVCYKPAALTFTPHFVIFLLLDRLALQCSSVCRWYINPLLPETTLLQQRYNSFHTTPLLTVCPRKKCSMLLCLLFSIVV